ncbi:MAG TPA: addiction module protein [Pyrinomonadaceae bacterium]|nr:addiction module protein [Pyrinomonadaceae bacterium]
MSTPTDEILRELLTLPDSERARLAEQLLESLEPQSEHNRKVWAEEAESRIDAFERGELNAVSGEEVFARLNSKFPTNE